MKKLKRPFRGSYPVTQTWGVNPGIYTRFGLKGHNGVDYGTPYGTPILAPHDGKVLEVYNDKNGYGLYVKIENDKEGSILAHLTRQDVKIGQNVKQWEQIGLSGNTGFSTGPHLHWGYYRKPRNKGDGYSGTINPYPYLTGDDPVVHPVDDSKNAKKASYFDRLVIKAHREGFLPDNKSENYTDKDIAPFIHEMGEMKKIFNRTTAREMEELLNEYKKYREENIKLRESIEVAETDQVHAYSRLREQTEKAKLLADTVEIHEATISSQAGTIEMLQKRLEKWPELDAHLVEQNNELIEDNKRLEEALDGCKADRTPQTPVARWLYNGVLLFENLKL